MGHPQTVDFLAEQVLLDASRSQREAFLLVVWKPIKR
jgi:hypothetical protein